MKKWILLGCWLFAVSAVQAQVPSPKFSEFWGQNKKMKKRLVEQVALLKLYYTFLKKGYELVQDGLQLIRDIKNGDFNLHNSYFNSLKTVNSSIRRYSKIEATTNIYEQIAQLYTQANKLSKDELFVASDRDAIERIFTGLLENANKDLQQLKLVTTSGNYALKDDERLEKTEQIYVAMRDKYAFAKDFANAVSLLLLQKKREAIESKVTGHIIGIKE